MSGWEVVSLGEVATIARKTVEPSDVGDVTAYVGLENIKRGGALVNVKTVGDADLMSTKFRFTNEQVLFGKLRPYLAKIARPNFSGVCSTDILPISPGSRLDRDYFAHFLAHPRIVALAASRATGANLPRLSPTELAKFPLPLPPLPEQRRIAEVLDQVDALRTKRREAFAHIDDLTQSIFLSMFGDPRTNPRTWTSCELSALVAPSDRINYGVVQPGDQDDAGVPIVRVGDLMGGRVNRSSLKRISHSVESQYSRSRLRGNEILISCVGSIGNVAVVGPEDIGSNIARAIARVPVENETTRKYVAAYLRTSAVQDYFTSELRTVSQPTLNIKQIAETRVLLPPIELQGEFASRVTAVSLLKARQQGHLDDLDALFASLQDRAFRGLL
ncbi:hypothetical protein Cs7R123_26190 [Catellatospora sp. TT07R-123]|uniref:restriction endonuclease subunit S n=1 Tax=Catellatospora sp. TT07R-123 TaxID=2733863 RepID=UPI001B096A22|nr:restriction endonuclease subunit S [Catellatospora sp. TT07R-123]GHJ45277.1 hypothetical protein Cs7R123_26190 [Catellatospora sp. TT07R-123]